MRPIPHFFKCKFLANAARICGGLLAVLVVVACENGFFESPLPPLPPANRGPIRSITSTAELDICYRTVNLNPLFDILKKKILIPYQDHTPSDMLIDVNKPNRNERLAIRDWYEQLSDCNALRLDLDKRTGKPQRLLAAKSNANEQFQLLVNRLYTKEISYGEFNLARLRLNTDIDEKYQALVAEIKKELAEQELADQQAEERQRRELAEQEKARQKEQSQALFNGLMNMKKLMGSDRPRAPITPYPQRFNCKPSLIGGDKLNCEAE